MGDFGDSTELLTLSQSSRRRRQARAKVRHALAALAALQLACVLAGCAGNDSGQLLIDPGRYDVYKCDDLAKRWKTVAAREKELRELMARAGESSGGAVIGALTYRADYDAVLSDEKLLQHTAAAKNCALTFQAGTATPSGQLSTGSTSSGQSQSTVYQSDQGIH